MSRIGRPRIEIDEDQLKALMRLSPTLADTAAFFGCCIDTIEKHTKSVYGLRFSEFREQNMVHTRFSLIRKAIQKAENGDNIMLIFCLKNLCNWRDKPAEETKIVIEKMEKMSNEELVKIAKTNLPKLFEAKNAG